MTDAARPDPVRMRAPPNEFVHAREIPGATADGVAGAARGHAAQLAPGSTSATGPLVLHVPETHGRFYALVHDRPVDERLRLRGRADDGQRRAAPSGSWARGWSGAGLPAGRAADRRADPHGADRRADEGRRGRPVRARPTPSRTASASRRSSRRRRPRGRPERRRRRTPPVGEVERMDAATFFRELARLMRDNPPRLQDRPIARADAPAGPVRRGRGRLGGADACGEIAPSSAARNAGLARIVAAAEAAPGEPVGSGAIRFGLGDFGTDYLAAPPRPARAWRPARPPTSSRPCCRRTPTAAPLYRSPPLRAALPAGRRAAGARVLDPHDLRRPAGPGRQPRGPLLDRRLERPHARPRRLPADRASSTAGPARPAAATGCPLRRGAFNLLLRLMLAAGRRCSTAGGRRPRSTGSAEPLRPITRFGRWHGARRRLTCALRRA